MRQIPIPVVDDEGIFDDIIAAKSRRRRGLLTGIRSQVLDAYASYAAQAPDLGRLPTITLTSEQTEALLHTYDGETAALAKLRSVLFSPLIVAVCPLCGIGEVSTLDHYLPKQRNPQYAVLSKNLVPACSWCNQKKSDQLLDRDTDVRLFLHPYYDSIPVLPFVVLDVSLHPSAIGLVFRVVQPSGMDDRTFGQLASHFQRLQLANRYRIMSLQHLRERRHSFARFYGRRHDAARLAVELAAEGSDYERDYGPNYWRTVLYRTLAGHSSFCDGGFSVLECL